MKNYFINCNLRAVAVIVGASMSTLALTAGRQIDFPRIGDANGVALDVDRVELSDTATILTMHGYYRPGWWIKIAPETTLKAGGKSYKLIDAKGMVPGKELWMPESGDSVFTMVFEPLPEGVADFDFVEGKGDGAFCIWNVDLTGKAAISEYPEGLPKELRRVPKDVPLPKPAYEIGKTTVKVHFLPYHSDRNLDNEAAIGNIFGEYDEISGKVNEADGTVTYSFNQYGPAMLYSKEFMLNTVPGETVNVYVDSRNEADYIMSRRTDDSTMGKRARIYSNGQFGELDMAMSRFDGSVKIPVENPKIWNYKVSGNEYAYFVAKTYRETLAEIDGLNQPEMVKSYLKNHLKNSVLYSGNSKSVLAQSYIDSHPNVRDIPVDSIKGDLSQDDFAKMASLFEICDENLVITPEIGYLLYGWRIDWTQYGAKCNPIADRLASMPYWGKAKSGELSASDIAALDELDNPFFSKALQAKNKEVNDMLESMKGDVKIEKTPNVPVDRLFDAIIEPYKGKVVVVDLWNTWCGPCRQALRHHEPKKDTKFKDKDIEWVYIADESSPYEQYVRMLPGIKGRHYRLTKDQIDYISQKFGVDGIPYYILVNKDGSYKGRPDMRDPNVYESEIINALK